MCLSLRPGQRIGKLKDRQNHDIPAGMGRRCREWQQAMAATPMRITGQPALKARYAPKMSATAMTNINPVFTWDGVSNPAWVTRMGPTRSKVSVPRSKSKTSFARLLAICSNDPTPNAARAGHMEKRPSIIATAIPVTTPAIETGKVLGRIASHQICKGVRGLFWSGIIIAVSISCSGVKKSPPGHFSMPEELQIINYRLDYQYVMQ